MTWKSERDLLIAQTMAFVQSVAEKTANTDRLPEMRYQLPSLPSPSLPSASAAQPFPAARPADVLPARLNPISHGDLREEIHRRVAAFRARQQAFNRDRDEYCNAMMAKVRAAREVAVRARDNPPPKR